jgi:hypothetical protein
MERKLDNMSHEQSEKNGWKTLKALDCEVVGKAIYDDGETLILKSTKRFAVEGGYIYNTSTEIHENERVAVAEALVFVPK